MRRLLCAILFAACAAPAMFAQNATIVEETKALPTYPFSDPDPVPIMARNPAIYPYFCFDRFAHSPVTRSWNVVRMENPYVRVYVMPGIGGKIWGAVEKKGGREFIYMNDAVKFRRIALRGPWTSGGIEFNFGIIGHTPSTATPVDYTLRTNADGSVTCFIGTLDLPSRTRWSVAITLPRDKAYIETRALWHNPTPYNQSYYTWTTAAVAAREDLQYFYAGRYMVPHSSSTANDPWPVDARGRDLSYYRNNRFEGSKSYFVFGNYRTTFGTYASGEGLGLGHWALHDDMPGQKVWIWSLFRDGAIWENLLTDRRGQYSEPQAGRLLSQVDHEFFPPYTLDSWRELWFPVARIGGLSAASPYGALHVEQQGDSLSIGICALQKFSEELVVRDGRKIVLRKSLSLKPLETFSANLSGIVAVESLTVNLGSKLSFSGDPATSELHRPLQYRLPAEDSPEGLFQSGLHHERQRLYDVALGKYRACLEIEPRHIGALCHAAALYGRRGEALEGLGYAARALTVSKYDPEANYWYGVLARQLGRLVDARETLGWAARSLEFRSNAYCQIAEILFLQGEPDAAEEYTARALKSNSTNSTASLLQALLLRKRGDIRNAQKILQNLLADDPLNHSAAFERSLGDPRRYPIGKVQIRTEIPHETFLESALWYAKLGCVTDALAILSAAPAKPMILCWSAYLLHERDPARSARLLREANGLSPDFVFPFREESLPVLEWAERESREWKPAYYRSLILWGKGRYRDALDLMSGRGEPDYATFFAARGILKKRLGERDAGKDFERAVSLDRNSWRNWHALTAHLAESGQPQAALRAAQDAAGRFPGQIVTAMDLAAALYAVGDFNGCLRELSAMQVLPYEGSWEAHDLFVRTNLEIAMSLMNEGKWTGARAFLEYARTYPEHLGTGEPYEPDTRIPDMLLALCDAQSGQAEQGQRKWQSAAAYTERHRLAWGQEHCLGVRALIGTGEKDAAIALLEEWGRTAPTDPMFLWARAEMDGNVQSMEILKSRHRGDPWFQIRLKALQLLGGFRQ